MRTYAVTLVFPNGQREHLPGSLPLGAATADARLAAYIYRCHAEIRDAKNGTVVLIVLGHE